MTGRTSHRKPRTPKTACATRERPCSRAPIKLAFAFASLMAAWLLIEIALRVFPIGPQTYAPRRFEPDGHVPFAQLSSGLIVYRPDTTFASIYDPAGDTRGYLGPEGRVTYHINALGLRGPMPAIPKPTGTYRIVCLGDSFTFGEGVHEADTWPAQLQSALQSRTKRSSIECINAGVQAYGTPEEIQLFLLKCLPLSADAVVLGFFLNDATDFAETIRQNDARTRAMQISFAGRASRLCEIIERRRSEAAMQETFFQTTRESFRSPQWQRCRDIIGGMQEFADDQHISFAVAIFPVLYDLDGAYPFEDLHATIRRDLQQKSRNVIDLLDTYRGHPAESLWVHPTDQHPNEIAQRLAAQRIAEVLAPDIRSNESR